jgi:hypothetical protein
MSMPSRPEVAIHLPWVCVRRQRDSSSILSLEERWHFFFRFGVALLNSKSKAMEFAFPKSGKPPDWFQR